MVNITFSKTLQSDGSLAHKFIRLPPPTIDPFSLRLVIIAGSTASTNPILVTNINNKHQELQFIGDLNSDHTVNIPILLPGSFYFKVRYGAAESQMGYVLVDPRLNLKDSLVPLDGINLLTIIPKWLPTTTHWPAFFNQFATTGYNMVHFAPVNQRGISNSPYSIKSQLSISDDLFDLKLDETEKEMALSKEIESIRDIGILSVTDVVWNHTSCDSEWLNVHPEAGYNLVTAPYLRPAYELDEALMEFSRELAAQNYNLSTIADLDAALSLFKDRFQQLRLFEFEIIDVQKAVQEFKDFKSIIASTEKLGPKSNAEIAEIAEYRIIKDPHTFKRFSKTVDLKSAHLLMDAIDQPGNIQIFERILNDINLKYYKQYDNDKSIIFEQIRNRAAFLRIDEHGPKLGPISAELPLVDTYFTRLDASKCKASKDELMLANNGWIWNADPLVNFAGLGSRAYLRREVIPWGDCVKLRYGNGPKDNPWLWKHMGDYTLKMAKLFHGFRIDNCHSTPIHVAKEFLKMARIQRPDLYVFAELFTGSEDKDELFVAELGLNSLIREAMNAWDTAELSRLVHRQGGSPIGSFKISSDQFPLDIIGHNTGSQFQKHSGDEILVEIGKSKPHALFMDCTHDNETPHQKRTAEDTLSTAALVAMSNSAIGSVKGYDEIVPKLLDVVNEKRKYRIPSPSVGIIPVKQLMYPLHKKMAAGGYTEIHVNQEHDYISVHRVHPVTHDGYLMLCRTAFKNQKSKAVHSDINLKNQSVKLLQCASISVKEVNPNVSEYAHQPGELADESDHLPPRSPTTLFHPFGSNDNLLEATYCDISIGCITGLPSTLSVSTTQSQLTKVTVIEDATIISIVDEKQFTPGSVVLYRTWPTCSTINEASDLVRQVHDEKYLSNHVMEKLWLNLGLDNNNFAFEIINQLGKNSLSSGMPWPDRLFLPGCLEAVRPLRILDINVAMYRCEPEERESINDGLYDIPGYGKLVYGGLQGIASVLIPACRDNDMGHPIFQNLRQGSWLIDYTCNRLRKYIKLGYNNLQEFSEWLSSRLELVKALPPTFIPKYFSIVIISAYNCLKNHALFGAESKICLSKTPSSLDCFAYNCSMTTFQMYGSINSSGLVPIPYPLPLLHESDELPIFEQHGIKIGCLAAGLPHFTTNYARVWGRDVFISLRGLLLIPGHFEVARSHLVAFGSTLKHGLLPNLLDHGRYPRYNARDAVWFWFSAVIDYCNESTEGLKFLEAKVSRRFLPLNRYRGNSAGAGNGAAVEEDPFNEFDSDVTYKYSSSIAQICHEIMERHYNGISFREWNAGSNLDHAMKSEGFNIEIGTNSEGFVYGGSIHNCGTWMDKMGDFEPSGNKGVPSTPREGSPIEIIGLQKKALGFIVKMTKDETKWPWKSVIKFGDGSSLLYTEWNDLVQKNFERNYFLSAGYYRDVAFSTKKYQESQIRPNQCIAMVHAPELFELEHCRTALLILKNKLVGPIGMKTLDEGDIRYRGFYDNNNCSHDPDVAHGANYHNGPEWVWVFGFFLRAYYKFFKDLPDRQFHINEIHRMISRVKELIIDYKSNPFAGLPELTNKDGAKCFPSCESQAWSSSVFLELWQEMNANNE